MKMNCDDLTPFIDAYIDGEFEEREQVEFEAHLDHCEACRRRVDFQLEFKRHLRTTLEAERAPDSLRTNILAALEAESRQMELEAASERRASRARRASILAAPLAASLAVLLLLPAFTIAPAASGQLPVVEETVEWHHGDYPLEVHGPDADTVSRWFLGKVDFPVRLPQFKAPGARLLGARIAHIEDRRAAYVLYEVDGARMSVMMFDGSGLEVPTDRVRDLAGHDIALMNASGYEVAVMQDHGVTYTLTTELDEDRFVTLMEETLNGD